MTDESKYSRHTYSYLALRRAVGCIAMLLPFVLMLGEYLIFGDKVIFCEDGLIVHEDCSALGKTCGETEYELMRCISFSTIVSDPRT